MVKQDLKHKTSEKLRSELKLMKLIIGALIGVNSFSVGLSL
jgi:hypothetical protein